MVKIATVGTNWIVDLFMDGVADAPEMQVIGACSRSEENARRLAGKYGLAKTYVGLDALAADDEVEAVYIATPNICHRDQAIKFLNAGKHVLVEKPAVTSYEDFAAIMAAAEANGRVFMEAMRPVHCPALGKLRELLGEIGPIRRAHLGLSKYSSRYSAFRGGEILNAFNPALQNSSLMDVGVYPVQYLIALFGPPIAITSAAVKLHNGFEGEGTILCRYEGMLAEIMYSKISTSRLDNEIQGEDGTIVFDDFDSITDPVTFTLYRRGQKEPEICGDGLTRHPMSYQLTDFCRAVAGELDVSEFQRYTGQAVRLMDEARRQNGVTFE